MVGALVALYVFGSMHIFVTPASEPKIAALQPGRVRYLRSESPYLRKRRSERSPMSACKIPRRYSPREVGACVGMCFIRIPRGLLAGRCPRPGPKRIFLYSLCFAVMPPAVSAHLTLERCSISAPEDAQTSTTDTLFSMITSSLIPEVSNGSSSVSRGR